MNHIFGPKNTRSERVRMTRRRSHYTLLRNRKWANIICVLLILLIGPIYPTFGSYIYNKTGGIEVYDIDEASILEAYEATGDDWASANMTGEGFIDVSVAVEQKRDWGDRDDIIKYTVKSGDSLGGLAESFGLERNTIRWANKMTSDTVRIGQELTILPVDGLVYTVKKGDGLSKVAKLYKISDKMNEILSANKMGEVADLKIGQSIILPGAKPLPKPKPKPKPKPVVKTPTRSTASVPTQARPQNTANAASSYAPSSGTGWYTLTQKVSSGCRNFAWGNCTCFVAKYKNVTWRGNGGQWYRNAAAQGVPVGKTARKGAIIVYAGPGYNPRYGHVGIVMAVEGSEVVVKDMNFRRLNEVTTRRHSISHPAIIGYIYVD